MKTKVKPITQRVKTYEQACKVLGINPKTLPIVSKITEDMRNYILAHYKLTIITQALNEGWKPDWNNTNEWKYTVWYSIKADSKNTNGSGFRHSDYFAWNSSSRVSSRLLFKSSELALYSGKQFKKLWKDYFLIAK